MEQALISLINKLEPKLSKTIRDVYKEINDVNILVWDEIKISEQDYKKILEISKRKLSGEDITFDIGYRYFRGNKLFLEKGVFVPQYDTEQIIDLVIKNKINIGKALEIGSGTGAISISLSNETNLDITSIDINPLATSLSIKNDTKNRILFLNEDFSNFLPNKKFDLIISNPPYISEDDKYVEKWVKDNQPKEALYAKNNGLSFYEMIFNKIPDILNINGYIILEIGYNQAISVGKIFSKISTKMEVIKDYEGHDRFIILKYEK